MITFIVYPLICLFIFILTLLKVSNSPNVHTGRILIATGITIIFGTIILIKQADFENVFILYFGHFTSALVLVPCLLYWQYNYFKKKIVILPIVFYILTFISSVIISLSGLYLSFFITFHQTPFNIFTH